MRLGENIFRLRYEKNMSQGDLADALNVSRQSVSKWENNNAVPDLDKLMKMSELFNVTLDSLVKGELTPEVDLAQRSQPYSIKEAANISKSQQIVGIILLCFGVLLFLMIFWATRYSAIYLSLFLSIPLILCGTFCLKVKRHLWLICLLTVYGYLWLPMGVLSPNYVNYNGARTAQLLHYFWGLWLMYGSRIWKKHDQFFTLKRHVTLFYVFLGLTCLITLICFLFPWVLPSPGLLRS